MQIGARVNLGFVLAGIAAFAMSVGLAAAQELPGDPWAGRTLALAECAACHEVEKGDRGAALPDPPGFQRIADNPAMTALALRVFLRTPHSDMPNLILSNAETDNLIAYILGLRRP